MHLYILRWNPAISSYKNEHHLDLLKHIKNNEQPTNFDWSISEYENLQEGDMFILQQVGTDNDGIAMIGKFKDKCYEADSWRKDGSKLKYADMWIMDAFDCNSGNPLPAERYEKLFPEIEWHGGHSGVLVDENLDDKLIDEIEKDLIKAGIWKEGELDKFMSWDFEEENAGKILLEAKAAYLKDKSKENFINFINCLMDFQVLIPMHVEKDEKGDNKCFPMILSNDDGDSAIPIFSNEEQIGDHYKEDGCEFYGISVPLCVDILNGEKDFVGIVLDPFTTAFMIDREMADLIAQLENESDEDNQKE